MFKKENENYALIEGCVMNKDGEKIDLEKLNNDFINWIEDNQLLYCGFVDYPKSNNEKILFCQEFTTLIKGLNKLQNEFMSSIEDSQEQRILGDKMDKISKYIKSIEEVLQ